jgi:hypothetical protein
MVKKWQTLIECHVDAKTTDGYLLRAFCIGFTTKDTQSRRKTCYAQTSQIKAIRKKMSDMITRDISSSDLKEVVNKLIPESIAKDVEKACRGNYPLHDVFIRKVRNFSCWILFFFLFGIISVVIVARSSSNPHFSIVLGESIEKTTFRSIKIVGTPRRRWKII